jgi:hypothetical protein
MVNAETGVAESCVDLYFLQQDGETYKVTKAMCPYFYIGVAVCVHAAVQTTW